MLNVGLDHPGFLSLSVLQLLSGGNIIPDLTLLELAPVLFGDRVVLCSSGWPETHESLAASSQMLVGIIGMHQHTQSP